MLALLETFTSAINELAMAVGYTVVVSSIVYAALKVAHGLIERSRD